MDALNKNAPAPLHLASIHNSEAVSMVRVAAGNRVGNLPLIPAATEEFAPFALHGPGPGPRAASQGRDRPAAEPSMLPFYLDDCFAFFHPARGGRGVVFCSALGIEELCTHRLVRRLAAELATAGFPTLRFDYPGTGNSLGQDSDAQRVAAWSKSIRRGIEWLRRETGVSEVVLIGWRLGALLCTQLAAELGDIDRLALLGPVLSGKSYLHEMKALRAMIGQANRLVTHDPTLESEPASDLEFVGFTMTRETVEALEQINLLQLQHAPAKKVLMLGKPYMPNDNKLATHLRGLGCEVEQEILPGYADMRWDATFADLPEDAFAGVLRWMARDPPGRVGRAPAGMPAILGTPAWREDAVLFGPRRELFGIHCSPRTPRDRSVILFVNHGANHHIGWARMFVNLSRRFAAQGIAAFRMDVAGIGDSPARPEHAENQLYEAESQQDVRLALDWLAAKGYRQCTVVGLCSGAYLSFYTAVKDIRVTGMALVNLQRFSWHKGDSLEVVMRNSYQATHWYFEQALTGQTWRRLCNGEINVSGIARALLKRSLKRCANSARTAAARFFGGPDRQDVLGLFRKLSERGVKMLLVYSSGDGGLDEIALHCGHNAKHLRKLPGVDFRIIEGADHNLTQKWAYEEYARILEEFLNGETETKQARRPFNRSHAPGRNELARS